LTSSDGGVKLIVMKNKKDKWEKPKLVVLIRSEIGENVLVICKWNGGPLMASNSWDTTCIVPSTGCNVWCETYSTT